VHVIFLLIVNLVRVSKALEILTTARISRRYKTTHRRELWRAHISGEEHGRLSVKEGMHSWLLEKVSRCINVCYDSRAPVQYVTLFRYS
jgi:hypothetical protein